MAALKPSIAWWCFENVGISDDQLIRAAAEIGYAGIELAPVEIWPRIAEAGLAIASHRGHGHLTDGLNNRANHDRIERELLASIELANQWNNPTLICFSGNRNGLDDRAGAENTAKGLRRVASAAEDAGVMLAVELLNSKIDHPDYQGDRTAWGIDVIEQVGSPAVKLLYDVYHMQVMEGDIIRAIQQHHQYFSHYHVAGNPGRNEPDATQELNYPAIYQAIAGTGFTGYVGMEFVPIGDPIEALNHSNSVLVQSLSRQS